MFPHKRNSHFPLVNGVEFQEKKSNVNGGRSQRKSIESDHWRFLEEIDAPMWVDLTLESKFINQDIDDAWFHVSHPFHQCSSKELRSAFSDLSEEKTNSNSDLLGPSSPKLPSSVSKSRGKDFRIKKWKGDDNATFVPKKHPIKVLGRKTLPVVSRPKQEVKPKTSFVNPKQPVDLKARAEPKSLITMCSSKNAKCTSNPKGTLARQSSSTETKQTSGALTRTSSGESGSASSENARSICVSNSVSANARSICESNSVSANARSICESNSVSANAGSICEGNSVSSNALSICESNSVSTHARSICETNSVSANASLICESNSANANARSISESNSVGANIPTSPNRVPSLGDSKNFLTSNNGVSVQMSQTKIVSEVTNQLFGHTPGLLSAVKIISLRRSIVTRQASRVEVKDGGKQETNFSVGSSSNSGCELKILSGNVDSKKVVGRQERNSSSGKSSMGSSSNSRCERKSINKRTDSRKAVTVAQPTKQNTCVLKSSKSKGPSFTGSRQDRVALAPKFNRQETLNTKVSNQAQTNTCVLKSSKSKGPSFTGSRQDRVALVPKFNRQETLNTKVSNQAQTKCRVRNTQDLVPVGLKVKNVADNRKVNPVGLNGEDVGKVNTTGNKVQCRKAPKNSSEVKDGKGSLDLKAKANERNKVKNPKNVVQKKVYFR